MAQRILILGDLVYDYNLLRLPGTHLSFSELLPSAVLSKRHGNAWYQAELLRIACSDLDIDIDGPDFGKKGSVTESQIAKAYSLWSQFDGEIGGKEKVWRIERFLGCEEPRRSRKPTKIPSGSKPDLLVIDDENLGFREQQDLWKGPLGKFGHSTPILFKTAVPIGKGALWEELLGTYADNLTLLLSVNHLRTQYAAISEALSWDLAIEELDREFRQGHLAAALSSVAQVIVYFNGAGAASYKKGQLDRFAYDPEELEGVWFTHRPGHSFGGLSIMTAAVARHMLQPGDYPLFVAISRAIAAARQCHDKGAGRVDGSSSTEMSNSFKLKNINIPVGDNLHPSGDSQLPECRFRAAFPKSRLTGKSDDGTILKSDLLQDLTGPGYEYVAAKAMDVAYDGPDIALASVPKARYGKYLTVDREEIERINEMRSLILSYSASTEDNKPLSIAVFGPPGSGKSFAIKQLAEELFGKAKSLEFNLSQFRSKAELHQAFHQVRDASLQGSIPLVFWDEFDTGDLRWLKEFLAPMQDAEFLEGGVSHPIGKAIFVFAGGVYPDFQGFNRSDDPASAMVFRVAKGPDFVSRLRGYVNIKGPNPQRSDGGMQSVDISEQDVAHLIRRAILLRSIIQRSHPELVNTANGRAAISSSVARAFLRVKSFRHGARSLEAIVSMSALSGRDFFGVAELPSPRLLNLHVTPDFMEHVRFGEIETETIEIIAEARHEAWREMDGGTPWDQLSEEDKNRDRVPARASIAMLQTIGYDIVQMKPGEKEGPGTVRLTTAEFNRLAGIEHELWLRNLLMEGYEKADDTDKPLHLHCDAVCFDKLLPKEKTKNRKIVEVIPGELRKGGYKLIRRVKVGVTGHRILMEEDKIIAGIEKALGRITSRNGDCRLVLLTSLAEGADRLVAESVLEIPGSQMVAVMPFDLDDYVADFGEEGSDSRRQFDRLLNRADKVVELPNAHTRNQGYENGGNFVVDNCDVLIAVWDKQGAQGQGGTADIVARARLQKKPLLIVKAGNRKKDDTGNEVATTLGAEQGKLITERFK